MWLWNYMFIITTTSLTRVMFCQNNKQNKVWRPKSQREFFRLKVKKKKSEEENMTKSQSFFVCVDERCDLWEENRKITGANNIVRWDEKSWTCFKKNVKNSHLVIRSIFFFSLLPFLIQSRVVDIDMKHKKVQQIV